MQNFSYLLADPDAKACALVDPGWEGAVLVDHARTKGYTVQAVLLTHTHYDHITALPEVFSLVLAPVYVHAEEAEWLTLQLPQLAVPIHPTHDGDAIAIGHVSVRCLHTPGHSPGGQCFLLDHACITGDALFIDGCGRVDLPGSDPKAMYHSLQKLKVLPADTIVYPGHNYGPSPTSTIGAQCRTNPYLRAGTIEEFFGQRL